MGPCAPPAAMNNTFFPFETHTVRVDLESLVREWSTSDGGASGNGCRAKIRHLSPAVRLWGVWGVGGGSDELSCFRVEGG